ncbi:hypothetical protein TNCV_494841 [Trichonephila clavipes]|nr:hypothetical protein TNCV_494841 [Trichonephila clavipes]
MDIGYVLGVGTIGIQCASVFEMHTAITSGALPWNNISNDGRMPQFLHRKFFKLNGVFEGRLELGIFRSENKYLLPPCQNDHHRMEAITGLPRYHTSTVPLCQGLGE